MAKPTKPAKDPGMEIHCDCRTAGAQSILITAKEMGATVKILHIDYTSFEGFSKDYEQCALYNKPYFIDTSVDPPIRLREWRAICVYLVFRQGGQVIPNKGDTAAYLSREQWEFFEVDMFTSRWYFMESYLPRIKYSKHHHVHFTKSLYSLPLEGILNDMEIMLFTPFMGGEVFTLLDIYLIPWFFRLISQHENRVFERRPNLADWWWRIKKRRIFAYLQDWMRKPWTEDDGVILNEGDQKFDWLVKQEHRCLEDIDDPHKVCNGLSRRSHSTAE